MAKKEETVSMIDTFSEFKELKNIDRTSGKNRLRTPALSKCEVRG